MAASRSREPGGSQCLDPLSDLRMTHEELLHDDEQRARVAPASCEHRIETEHVHHG